MPVFKKIILSFLSFLIIFTSSLSYFSVPKTYAQNTQPWYYQSFSQWYTKVYDEQTSPPQEIFGERYTAAQVQWVIYSIISFIVYPVRQTVSCIFKGGGVNNCIQNNPLTGYDTRQPLPTEKKSVLATIFDSNRPLSGVNYVRSKLASFHVIPQAEAQVGFGFNALNPVQNIWRACRDIMYGFFVIIIIIFAFMIMFRVKLNPQTVVTVQSAIPKIIITLILVTFSYAIAGLLIDLTYVVIGLVALIFSQFGFLTSVFRPYTVWSKLFELITVGPGVGGGMGGIIGWFMGFWVPFMAAFFGSCRILFIGSSVGGGLMGVMSVAGYIIGVFFAIGLFFWLLVTAAKVIILLIKTYLSILISIIFAPFMIGFGILMPTGGFSSWVKGLVSNLLVYPLTGVLILLSILFLSGTYPLVKTSIENLIDVPAGAITDIFGSSYNGQYWYPPMTLGVQTGEWDPLPILWTFAALGIFALIPKTADIIKGLMSGKGVGGGGDLKGIYGYPAAAFGFLAGTLTSASEIGQAYRNLFHSPGITAKTPQSGGVSRSTPVVSSSSTSSSAMAGVQHRWEPRQRKTP